MKSREKGSSDRSFNHKGYIQDLHRELEESKRSVTDLLRLRQTLFLGGSGTDETVKAYKEKAIDAINQLFDDELKGV